MIVINRNIEGREYHYKDWYKKMETLVGKELETTSAFENSVSIGQKILIDEEDPSLPSGVTIPDDADFSIEDIRGKALVINDITQIGNNKTIKVGIRSIESADLI